jgi:hypothetical protein
MALLAYLVPFVGSIFSMLGLPAAIASRRTASAWVDRGLFLGLAGTAIAMIGSALVGMWWMIPASLVVMLASLLLREQVPGRPKRRGLERSVSGLLARTGWWLSGKRHRSAFAAATVRVERVEYSNAVYTLEQIRQELVGQVLEVAEHNPTLNLVLDNIADQIEVAVLEVGQVTARPNTARYGMARYASVSDFAASVLTHATEPGAHRTVRRYGPYSATVLKLAAACRLVERGPAATPISA